MMTAAMEINDFGHKSNAVVLLGKREAKKRATSL
jgi:hypothetical protein